MQAAAILTGDLIGSTEAGPEAVSNALRIIAEAAEEVGGWRCTIPPADPPRFTRFRGDGWQFSAPFRFGPRAVLLIQARLIAARGLQSRIALGLGAVEHWGSADLSDASGPALVASGRALDALTPGKTLTLAGAPDLRDGALLALCDAIARRWSAEQAEAAALALHPDKPRQTALAKAFGISIQAVSQRLRSADVPALLQAMAAWETALAEAERRIPDERRPR